MKVRWFGESWGAPVCEDLEDRRPTPVGEACMQCGEPIAEASRGLLIVHVDREGPARYRPHHLACYLRSIGAPLPICVLDVTIPFAPFGIAPTG